jgi:hypothetical protein
MGWCEANRVDYVFGLARNRRLEAALVNQLAEAKRVCAASGRPARVFRDFQSTSPSPRDARTRTSSNSPTSTFSVPSAPPESRHAAKTPGLLIAVPTRALMDSHYGRPKVRTTESPE